MAKYLGGGMENKDMRIVPLKELLDGSIRNGYSPLPADNETGYWVLGLGALGDDGIKVDEIKPVAPHENVLSNILNVDDFLVSRSNTPDKVGRSIRFRGEIENCSYPDLMMRFRIDEQKADIFYIEQMLKSSGVRAYFKSCAAGSSSTMVKINKGVLEKTPISIPKLEAQKKIAQILSTWDQAVSTTEQLLANSQQQKKALMQQLLTGKKRLLDENGVVFGGEWGKFELEAIFFFKKGKGLSKGDVSETGKNKCLLYGELYTRYPEVIGTIISRTNSFDGTPSVAGDILIPSSTTTNGIDLANATAILEDNVLLGGDINILRPKKSMSSEFIAHLLTHIKKHEIASRAQGITIIHLYGSDLKDIEVTIPKNIKEQQKIATVFSTADQEIAALQKKLVCLRQQKKALMQQLLTGKRRVKVDAY